MSILSYARLDGVIDHLITYNKEPISLKYLAHIFKVSERTIWNDIILINEDIIDKGARVRLYRGKGYKLIALSPDACFYSWWMESKKSNVSRTLETPEDRQTHLLFLLLTSSNAFTLDQLMNSLFVSKNTFYSYLKTTKDLLAPFQLKILNRANIGFSIVGSEFSKRQAAIELLIRKDLEKYVLNFSEIEYRMFNAIDLSHLKDLEIKILKPLDLSESDYYHKNILSVLALTIVRIQHGFFIEEIPMKVPNAKKMASESFDWLLGQIEVDFQVSLDALEREYLYYHLLSNFPRLADVSKQSQDILFTSESIVSELLEEIKETTLYDWTNDATLKKDLVAHIKNFIGLELYNQNRINPLRDTIRKSFPLAHNLSVIHINKIADKYGIYFSEDEIGYIALHLAGAIERNELSQHSKLNVVIVCSSGLAMSKLIELKITKKFTETIHIVKVQSYIQVQSEILNGIDFIISTVPLEHKKTPIYLIDIANIEKGLDNLTAFISSYNGSSHYINELFFPKHFHVFNEAIAKNDILKTMVSSLIEEKVTDNDSSFLESIYRRESIASTAIDTNIAIPHPMGLLAKKSVISVGIVPAGVDWERDTSVQFIFLFAISKTDYENTTQVYDLLLSFMEDKDSQTIILKNPNFNGFIDVFQKL